MALQVWLPLNGNLNNQGLTNWQFTNNNATVDNSGKIGKCYAFSGSSQYLRLNQKVIDTSQFTISFWMYATDLSANRCIFSTRNVTSGAVNIYLLSAGIRFDTSNGANWQTGFKPSANTWYHITLVQDATTKYLYVNGVLNTSTAGTTDLTQVSSVCTIGCEHINGSSIGTYFAGKLNDFRIYDHALSPKEIEILSRGLVCHYPLNNNGGGQPNLYDFESVVSKWLGDLTRNDYTDLVYGNVVKCSTGSSISGDHRIYRNVSNVWTADQKYTVSFLAKASKTATVKVSRSLGNYAPTFTVSTEWKRYSGVITCSTTATGGTLSIQLETTNTDLYITQIKVELGDKATAYCPGVGDSHYIPLGYDSTTEYDVSGYQYNLDSHGTITYSSDTPRYSVCPYYQNTDMYLSATSPTDSVRTVSFWVKYPSAWSEYRVAFADYKSKLSFGFVNASRVCCTCSSNLKATFNITTPTVNTWYHVVVRRVSDSIDADIDLFINGVQQTSRGANDNWNHTTDTLMIGRRSTGASIVGYMSDFRAYSTILSDTQIAELYNTAVSVANNGTLLGYELVEV